MADPIADAPVSDAPPVVPANNLAPTPADAPPSFQVDSEAFVTAAPEGYDTESAKSMLETHKGNVHSIIKSSIEAQKAFSSRMPVPDLNDPEKMSAVYAKMGVPAEAAGYEYGEDVKFTSDEAKGQMSDLFKGLNISTPQANGLLKWYQGQNESSEASYDQGVTDGLATTESFIQSESGGLKGSKAYNDYWNTVESAAAVYGVDVNSDSNSDVMSTDVGRKMVTMAYALGSAARPGTIPGMHSQTDTVGSLNDRKNELYKEMSKPTWNESKQGELDSIKQQLKQYTKRT